MGAQKIANDGRGDQLLTEDPITLVLIETTRFKPQSDIKNILITGGAGFT